MTLFGAGAAPLVWPLAPAEAQTSQKFGVNAAWLRLNVVLYNLPAALRRTALPEEFRAARPKRLRFVPLNPLGRVIRHARETLPRLGDLFQRQLYDAGRLEIPPPPCLAGE